PDRVAADRATLDQQMRIALHQHMVLERTGLALIRVARDVFRPGCVLEDELPLQPGREAGTAAPAQPRRLHLLDDVVRLQRERLAPRLVPTRVLHVEVERVGARLANELSEYWLIAHFIQGA